MNCQHCGLKIEMRLPVLIVEATPLLTFLVKFLCRTCGQPMYSYLQTMKPYTADRCDVFPARRGEYQVAPDGSVNFTCPVCKCVFGLKPSSVHKIEEGGKITPSVVCPNGCGFHAWMTLKDWKIENNEASCTK